MTAPVVGVWQRLSLLSKDSSLSGLNGSQLLGRLDEFGIPRDQAPLARAVQSWQRASVPPDVALAMWLLRDRQAPDGCFYRRPDLLVAECGPAIRYIQTATLA